MVPELDLERIPERAQAKLSMALAFTQVQAGIDMLAELMKKHHFLNDQLPVEWPFKISLEELGIECLVCAHKYRDSAITEIAQGILDQLVRIKQMEGKRG